VVIGVFWQTRQENDSPESASQFEPRRFFGVPMAAGFQNSLTCGQSLQDDGRCCTIVRLRELYKAAKK
jgi:hypothetical protein